MFDNDPTLDFSTGPKSIKSESSIADPKSKKTWLDLDSRSTSPLTAGQSHHAPPIIIDSKPNKAIFSTLILCSFTTLVG